MTAPSFGVTPPARRSRVSRPASHVLDVVGKLGSDLVEIEPVYLGTRVRGRFAMLGVLLPPSAHPRLERVAHRHAEPRVEASYFADRIGLHGAKVDVVEPVVGAAIAEREHALHARGPLRDVESTDVR